MYLSLVVTELFATFAEILRKKRLQARRVSLVKSVSI